MLDGPSVAAALSACGITHVIWIPDSETGTWESSLSSHPNLRLLRVCRESEAIGIAAGLMLGGQRPVVVIQCTGLFDAGDALRNIVHDLKLPLFLIVGLRGYHAFQRRATRDTCPVFTEPVLKAWQISYTLFDEKNMATDLEAAIRDAQRQKRAGAVLLAE